MKHCIVHISGKRSISLLSWSIFLVVQIILICFIPVFHTVKECVIISALIVLAFTIYRHFKVKDSEKYDISCLQGLGLLLSKIEPTKHCNFFVPHQVISNVCIYETVSMIELKYLVGLEISVETLKLLLPITKGYYSLSLSQLEVLYREIKKLFESDHV